MICTPCSLNTSWMLACSIVQHLGARARLAGTAWHTSRYSDVEVRQRRLEHPRRRRLQHARGAPRRLQQHRLDLAPRRVVADGDRGVEDVALAP